MSSHERLLQLAKDAIERLFSDTSVSPETTEESLTELLDDCQAKIECIKADREE